MLHIKSISKKRVLTAFVILVLVILSFVITNLVTKNRFNNYIVLSLLYLTNKEEIRFSDMILRVPFDYYRKSSENKLVLMKFPKGGDVIIITRNRYVPIEDFWERFKKYFERLQYSSSDKIEITVGGEKGCLVSGCSNVDPSQCEAFVTVPQKAVTASFTGEREHLPRFSQIVRGISFLTVENVVEQE